MRRISPSFKEVQPTIYNDNNILIVNRENFELIEGYLKHPEKLQTAYNENKIILNLFLQKLGSSTNPLDEQLFKGIIRETDIMKWVMEDANEAWIDSGANKTSLLGFQNGSNAEIVAQNLQYEENDGDKISVWKLRRLYQAYGDALKNNETMQDKLADYMKGHLSHKNWDGSQVSKILMEHDPDQVCDFLLSGRFDFDVYGKVDLIAINTPFACMGYTRSGSKHNELEYNCLSSIISLLKRFSDKDLSRIAQDTCNFSSTDISTIRDGEIFIDNVIRRLEKRALKLGPSI